MCMWVKINLPALAQLVSSEMVQGLACLEASCRLAVAHIWQEEWTCEIQARRWVVSKRGSRKSNETLYVRFGGSLKRWECLILGEDDIVI